MALFATIPITRQTLAFLKQAQRYADTQLHILGFSTRTHHCTCLQQAFYGSHGVGAHTLAPASAHSHLDGGRLFGEPRQRAEHAAPDEQVRHRRARAGDGCRVVQQLQLALRGGASLAGGDGVDDRLDVPLDVTGAE